MTKRFDGTNLVSPITARAAWSLPWKYHHAEFVHGITRFFADFLGLGILVSTK